MWNKKQATANAKSTKRFFTTILFKLKLKAEKKWTTYQL